MFRADAVSTAQTAQTMCFCCSLSTAREIMETGNLTVHQWTDELLVYSKRSTAEDTANALVWHQHRVGQEGHCVVVQAFTAPSLTSSTVHQLTTNLIDEAGMWKH